MSTLAKLSKQAVQLEHDRQYEKALALFSRLFDEAASTEEEVDVALFNRAGDVAMRLGDGAAAIRYYERAVDAYAAGGLLNNAIAVCNKMLRQAPDHAATYYTLGVLHAKQGFRGDAKHHFVEYAERVHRAGQDDEALRALSEFAALCPAGDDARAALTEHLAKGNRGAEVTMRLQAILTGAPGAAASATPQTAAASAGRATPAIASATVVDDGARSLVFLDVSPDGLDAAPASRAVAGLEPTAFVESLGDVGLDLASTLDAPEPTIDELTFEPTLDIDFGTWSADEPALEPLDLALDAPEPFELDAPTVTDRGSRDPHTVAAASPRWVTALPGELPMLSLAGWIGSASAVGVMESVDLVPSADPTARDGAPEAELSTELHFLVDETADDVVVDEGRPVAPGETPVDDVGAPEPGVATSGALAGEEFVDLGAWLRDSEPAPSTRMTTGDAAPTGDESADFERMLGVFRAGVARNVDVEDYASHYDLGVAFREMGLVEDAIAEFQKAARAPAGGLRAREALGQCFLDRGSPELAVATLQPALDEHATGRRTAGDDGALLGVLYLLGVAHTQLGGTEPARTCFERVAAADIRFRDAAARLSQLSALRP